MGVRIFARCHEKPLKVIATIKTKLSLCLLRTPDPPPPKTAVKSIGREVRGGGGGRKVARCFFEVRNETQLSFSLNRKLNPMELNVEEGKGREGPSVGVSCNSLLMACLSVSDE